MPDNAEVEATGNEKILTIEEQNAMLDAHLQQSDTQVDTQDSQGEVSQNSEEQQSPKTTEKNESDKPDPPKAKEKSDSNKASSKDSKFNKEFYKDMDKDQLIEQLERQEEKVHKAHKTIGRQGKDLGDIKKELESISKEKELLQKEASFSDEEYNELVDENPAAAARRANQANNAERQLSELDKRELAIRRQAFIQEKIPNYNDYQDQINEIVNKDQEHFQGSNVGTSEIIDFNLAKRAEADKEISGWKGKFETLEKQYNDLNSKLEKQPKHILNQINEAAKTPSFGVDSGYSQTDSSTSSGTSKEIHDLRDLVDIIS